MKFIVVLSVAAAAVGFYVFGADGLWAGVIGFIGLKKSQPKRGPVTISKEAVQRLEKIEETTQKKQDKVDVEVQKQVDDAKSEADKIATDNKLAGDKLDSLLDDTAD